MRSMPPLVMTTGNILNSKTWSGLSTKQALRWFSPLFIGNFLFDFEHPTATELPSRVATSGDMLRQYCQMSFKVNSFLKFLKWLIRPLFSRTAGARRLGNAEPGFPDRGQRQNSKMNR